MQCRLWQFFILVRFCSIFVLICGQAMVRAVAWSADSTKLATASDDGTAVVWAKDRHGCYAKAPPFPLILKS